MACRACQPRRQYAITMHRPRRKVFRKFLRSSSFLFRFSSGVSRPLPVDPRGGDVCRPTSRCILARIPWPGPRGRCGVRPRWCRCRPRRWPCLWRLASQAGQVVTKAALLDTVWAETAVSEGVLAVVSPYPAPGAGGGRQAAALSGDGTSAGVSLCGRRSPRAPVPPPATPPAHGAPPAPQLVGREAEMAQLHTCFAQAQQGQRQIVLVTGEAGMGKTTLVDAVVHQLAAAAGCGWGAGSASNTMGRGKRICRCWRRWGGCGGRPGRSAWWRACASMPRAGWRSCPALLPAGDAGGPAAPVPGATPGAHAAGAGRGPGGADGRAAAGAGARRPALE